MNDDIVIKVQERYGEAARHADRSCDCDCGALGCCGVGQAHDEAKRIGYSEEELKRAGDGNLGLGCGNPLALAGIRPGMTVLDLGSGAGLDAFLAAERVGPDGRVIGVDMTPDMLALAKKNAASLGRSNVEFREGRIEALPVADASVDLVISNCVINLSVDKPAVFREIFRVLKPGGALSVSDLVLTAPLPDRVRESVEAYVGCVAGASLIGDYLAQLFQAGFTDVALPKVAAYAAGGCCDGADARAVVSATFSARKPA